MDTTRTDADPRVPNTADANQAEFLTASEVIELLRLGTDDRNPSERLRNLIRRHGLPVIRRGKLRLFRRSAIDAWLDDGQRGHSWRKAVTPKIPILISDGTNFEVTIDVYIVKRDSRKRLRNGKRQHKLVLRGKTQKRENGNAKRPGRPT